MQYSMAFNKLSGNEIRLYLHMRMKFHKEEKEDKDFEYSKSLGVKVLRLSEKSENSVRRALKNLVKYGFIDITFISKGGGKNNKIPNRYKFSERWKTIEINN